MLPGSQPPRPPPSFFLPAVIECEQIFYCAHVCSLMMLAIDGSHVLAVSVNSKCREGSMGAWKRTILAFNITLKAVLWVEQQSVLPGNPAGQRASRIYVHFNCMHS